MAKATVHSSATVRDITAIAKRVIEGMGETPRESLLEEEEFIKRFTEEAAGKIDWKHLIDTMK